MDTQTIINLVTWTFYLTCFIILIVIITNKIITKLRDKRRKRFDIDKEISEEKKEQIREALKDTDLTQRLYILKQLLGSNKIVLNIDEDGKVSIEAVASNETLQVKKERVDYTG